MPLPDYTSDLHGNSELQEDIEMRIDGVFKRESTAFIPLGHSSRHRVLGQVFDLKSDGDPGHALTFGTTRSGKGVSAIIPALLTYAGSMVVIDPKLENAWITAPYRRDVLKQRVVILDPWNEVNERYGSQVGVTETVTRFNPLSYLRPGDPNFNDDIVAMADALTLRSSDTDSHWVDSARELIAGLIAAAVEAQPGTASLRDVRELLTGGDELLAAAISESRLANPDSLAARKLRRFEPKMVDGVLTTSKEMTSIRSTAETQTAFLDSGRLLDSMQTDDPPFDLAELVTGKVTLYVGLPVDRLQTHGRWLRLILTLAIRAISRQKRPPELPVMFMLDEFGTISPGSGLSMIEQSFGLMAGLGIRIWAFLQDLPQLQRDYPKSWETFISNSSLIQVLNCADATTSKYVSEYLGTKTVNAKTGSMSYKQVPWERDQSGRSEFYYALDAEAQRVMDQGGPQYYTTVTGARRAFTTRPKKRRGDSQRLAQSEASDDMKQRGQTPLYNTKWVPDQQLASRPVLFPHEVRESPETHSILIFPRRGNFRLERFVYYSDPSLSPRARPDPNKPSPKIVPDRSPPPPTPDERAEAARQAAARAAAAPPPPPPEPSASAAAMAAAGASASALAGKLGRLAARAGGVLKQKVEEKIDDVRHKKE